MKRRPAALASLWLLAFAPGVGFVACSNSATTTETPDAGPDGVAPPTPDASTDGTVGVDSAADGTSGDVAAANDGGGGDGATGNDAADTGPPCAPVTAIPVVIDHDIATGTTWTCDHVYLVQGTIQVLNPGVSYADGGVGSGTTPTTVLTIEPGTTVLMSNDAHNNGNLLVLPGAELNAVGTRDRPIVFTSQALNTPGQSGTPGDWGAIALIGWAPGNYGAGGPDGGPIMQNIASSANDWYNGGNGDLTVKAGSYDPTHNTDSSGTLKYVRLEYGGSVKADPQDAGWSPTKHEMLGLYGAGSGTTLSYVDIRQGVFGCIFAEGGQFLADHILCQFHGQSGGFDVSRGNQSKAQFIVVQESPDFTSEGIGVKGPSESAGAPEELDPLTAPTIYNVTTCGSFGGSAPEDPFAFFMNRAPAGTIANFIGTGYYAGIGMYNDFPDGGPALTQMMSSILWNNADPNNDAGSELVDPISYGGTSSPSAVAWFNTPGWNNTLTVDPNIQAGCQNAKAIALGPPASLTTNAATPPNDGFFDATATYIGAFKDGNDAWATGAWVVWNPQ